MRFRFTRSHVLLGTAAVLLAIPVLAQAPESILPPDFGTPQPPPRAPIAPPAATPTPRPSSPEQPLPTGSISEEAPGTLSSGETAGEDLLQPAEDQIEAPDTGLAYDLPPRARRSLERIGLLTPALGGLGPRAFGVGFGADKARIMAATRAPVASRWASILLRRALISQSDTPSGIDGADWAAERAWLLLRMGEADNARLLVQSIDNDRYSTRLYAVAMQAMLASADPAGLCPLLPRARDFSREPSWFMAQAICASFSGDQNSATDLLNQASRRGVAHGIDYRLSEKTVGSGPNSRRSVRIEWEGVSRLTSWRFGLATATNVAIPEPLYATAGQQVRAWEARAPMLTPAQRVPGVATATRLGVFSGAASRGFLDVLAAQGDADGTAQDMGAELRTAYAGDLEEERIAAMRALWSRAPGDGARPGPGGVAYGALPAIARAAASLTPDKAAGEDAPWLLAAMLSGGYDRNAARWSDVVDTLQGAARQRSWALLATGTPQPRVDLSTNRVEDFISQDESPERRYARTLVAALGGLGRLAAEDRAQLLTGMDIDPTPRTRWSRAIMAAANRGEKGTVALLVAVGMQTDNWQIVPATHLYFMTAALRRVGLDPYARMIAAEAMARTG